MVSEDCLEELTPELNISLLLIFPERVGFSLIKKKVDLCQNTNNCLFHITDIYVYNISDYIL